MNAADIVTDASRRADFVLLFDVTDGNPNGDPDAGNLPRVDPETMQGLVTDVCLKRKVRNFVDATRAGKAGMEIYVKHHGVLNEQHERAYEAEDIEPTNKPDEDTMDTVRQWMCANFYDVRAFGAVMTTGVNCGQVRGPLQLTFARSVDPVVPLDLSITRVAVTRSEDKMKAVEGSDEKEATGKVTEMGRKTLIPYGLYLCRGFYNPHLGEDTGFGDEDLALFWEALRRMWELDRSASRGMMACRGLYVFTHDSKLGEAPAHELFELVSVERKDGVEAPRSFNDYTVNVDRETVPDGVTLTAIVG
ncbi:MAG: type I-C CRISPR-associated protein Cas7/Csd2 [Candidatus Brocadiia bacterium]